MEEEKLINMSSSSSEDKVEVVMQPLPSTSLQLPKSPFRDEFHALTLESGGSTSTQQKQSVSSRTSSVEKPQTPKKQSPIKKAIKSILPHSQRKKKSASLDREATVESPAKKVCSTDVSYEPSSLYTGDILQEKPNNIQFMESMTVEVRLPTIVHFHKNTNNSKKSFISVLGPDEIEIFVLKKSALKFKSLGVEYEVGDVNMVKEEYITCDWSESEINNVFEPRLAIGSNRGYVSILIVRKEREKSVPAKEKSFSAKEKDVQMGEKDLLMKQKRLLAKEKTLPVKPKGFLVKHNIFKFEEDIQQVLFHPSDGNLLFITQKNIISCCNIRTKICAFSIHRHNDINLIKSIDINKSGKFLASASTKAITVWNVDVNDSLIKESIENSYGTCSKVGKIDDFLSESTEFNDHRGSVTVQNSICQQMEHTGTVDCVKWYGEIIVSKDQNENLMVWELESKSVDSNKYFILSKIKLNNCKNKIKMLFDINYEQRIMALGNRGGTLFVWDLTVPAFEKIPRYDIGTENVTSVTCTTISDCGRMIVFISEFDNKIFLWYKTTK